MYACSTGTLLPLHEELRELFYHGEDAHVRRHGDDHRAEGGHPQGMFVVAHDGFLVRRHEHDEERDREDEAVQRAREDEGLHRLADDGEDEGGEDDERDDEPAVVRVDPFVERADEGYGGVRRADYGGDGRRPHDDAEDLVAHVARGEVEDGRRRVRAVQREARADDAERRQEEEHAHHAGEAHAGDGAAGDLGDRFFAGDARVDEAVPAGEGDVAADGAAHDSDDGHGIDGVRRDGLHEGFAHGRRGGEGHVQGEHDHHEARELGEAVHQAARFLHDEDGDGQHRADDRAGHGVEAEEHVEAHARAGDVADIEGKAAQHDERRHEVAQARQDHVRHILPALAGDADDAPYVELRADVEDDGGEDDEAEARLELFGEYGGLREEARSDGRGRHQEGRAQQDAPVKFFHGKIPLSDSGNTAVTGRQKKRCGRPRRGAAPGCAGRTRGLSGCRRGCIPCPPGRGFLSP